MHKPASAPEGAPTPPPAPIRLDRFQVIHGDSRITIAPTLRRDFLLLSVVSPEENAVVCLPMGMVPVLHWAMSRLVEELGNPDLDLQQLRLEFQP